MARNAVKNDDTMWEVILTLVCGFLWIGACFLSDQFELQLAVEKWVVLIVAAIVNAYTWYKIYSTTRRIGSDDAAQKNPETVLSIFAHVLNVMQSFGLLLATAQYFSRQETDAMFASSLLDNTASAVLNSALVQSGVGLVDLTPKTVLEKIVIWLTAYVGGILVVNIFLITVLFTRRAWFNQDTAQTGEKQPIMPSSAEVASVSDWSLRSVVAR